MKAGISGSLKENVLIAAGKCCLTVLPEFGGKIASLSFHGQELLQAPLAPIAPRTPDIPFDKGDASGWDECLPSVAACTVAVADGPADIPDHGDLWRVPWDVTKQDGDSIALRGRCFSLPLTLERGLTLAETDKGVRLDLAYQLTNTGEVEVPWAWAAHPLFAAAEGDRICLPDSIRSLRLEGSRHDRLGRNGDTVSWPVATLSDGSQTDLSVAQAPGSGIGDKLFAGPLSTSESWCALERPRAGVRIRVGFDAAATPYLGLWICYGGWPERPGPRQVCVAMEPATAPVDSLAVDGPWSRRLAPGHSFRWAMQIEVATL